MRILVLTGSPHRRGTSNTLADEFIKGVQASGHEVIRFDTPFLNIHLCIGCDRCGMNGPCVFKDDMPHILDKILKLIITLMQQYPKKDHLLYYLLE